MNYFGKCDTIDKVEVSPLLLKKGATKLALYGLGCIRDERLHRLFEQQKVKIVKPREETGSWFNLFTIHQVCWICFYSIYDIIFPLGHQWVLVDGYS